MSTTIREESPSVHAEKERSEWALVVAHHSDPSAIGVRRVIAARAALDLGRESGAFGERSLDDPLVSRRHARVELDSAGQLQICDLGSANGTWVNGARAALAALDEGDVVRVGPVLLAVQRAPATYSISRSSKAPSIAWSTARFSAALRRAIEARGVLFLRAPCESAWRPYLQRCVDDIANTGGARLVIAPDSEWGAWRTAAVFVRSDASEATMRELIAQRSAVEKSGALVILVSADGDSTDETGPTRESSLRFPSLPERVEDIPLLVRSALHDALGRDTIAIDHSLALRLLRATWPEDTDGLLGWAAVAARRAKESGAGLLAPSDEDLRYLGDVRSTRSAARASEPARAWSGASAEFVISRHGSWFVSRGEKPVDLRTRYALARVLRALVAGHERDASATLSIDELVDAGWPGEKLVGESGVNRLYVAVGTLRKLGLRELIERREGGYRLAPSGHVEIAAPEAPPTAGGST